MAHEEVDCIIIGAGAVGLAVARALALAGREVIVLEQAAAIGTGISSRNSEVIHAGIYYPQASLKASLCVAGRPALYDYLKTHGLPYRACGKLIVAAAAAQDAELADIARRAQANGVDDIRMLSRSKAQAMEPALTCTAALHSPSTGILDVHAYMLSLQGEIEDCGGVLAFKSPVEKAHAEPGGMVLEIGGATPVRLKARAVVNSAGLAACALAAKFDGLDPAHIPTPYFAKGNYFVLSGPTPFNRLIYPVPEKAGLGIHLTLDMAGQARFGPDVEWIDHPPMEAADYAVDPARATGFYAAIRTYWPALPDGALVPGYAGVRPKLQAPGESAQDFRISGPADHGLTGLVNLFGIESPGLTASLAIANHVAGLLDDRR